MFPARALETPPCSLPRPFEDPPPLSAPAHISVNSDSGRKNSPFNNPVRIGSDNHVSLSPFRPQNVSFKLPTGFSPFAPRSPLASAVLGGPSVSWFPPAPKDPTPSLRRSVCTYGAYLVGLSGSPPPPLSGLRPPISPFFFKSKRYLTSLFEGRYPLPPKSSRNRSNPVPPPRIFLQEEPDPHTSFLLFRLRI